MILHMAAYKARKEAEARACRAAGPRGDLCNHESLRDSLRLFLFHLKRAIRALARGIEAEWIRRTAPKGVRRRCQR